MGEQPAVAIVFTPSLQIRTHLFWPTEELRLGDRRFRKEISDWIGFYDWLRDSDGILVAVQFWPFEEELSLLTEVGSLGHVTRRGDFGFKIQFVRRADTDLERSHLQCFLYMSAYRDPEGTIALLLDSSDLRDADLASLGEFR